MTDMLQRADEAAEMLLSAAEKPKFNISLYSQTGRSLAKLIQELSTRVREQEKADLFFDADEWEFTTEDESLILDDGLAYSKTGIVSLGRMRRLPDKYVIQGVNEDDEADEQMYFDTLEEAQTAKAALTKPIQEHKELTK